MGLSVYPKYLKSTKYIRAFIFLDRIEHKFKEDLLKKTLKPIRHKTARKNKLGKMDEQFKQVHTNIGRFLVPKPLHVLHLNNIFRFEHPEDIEFRQQAQAQAWRNPFAVRLGVRRIFIGAGPIIYG